MPRLPDSSDYYVPELALRAEIEWCLTQPWKAHLEFLRPHLERHNRDIETIIEVGCATGHLGLKLPDYFHYRGMDKNPWFIAQAQKHAAKRRDFSCHDGRAIASMTCDLAMAWDYLKHFALEEWDSILEGILKAGNFSAFNVQVCDEEFDNGKHFHHVFVTLDRVRKVVAHSGHEIEDSKQLSEFEIDGKQCSNVAFWTARREQPKTQDGLKLGTIVDEPKKSVPAEKTPDEAQPTLQAVQIDNVPMMDLSRCAIRWVKTAHGAEPELYRDGKRVTKSWRLKMEYAKEADTEGKSANTD